MLDEVVAKALPPDVAVVFAVTPGGSRQNTNML